MVEWFARPVLHVASVEASLRCYVDQLGFAEAWRYEEDRRPRVVQVDRTGCALILSDQWPEKVGKGLMFISLNIQPETSKTAVAALHALRAELEARGVAGSSRTRTRVDFPRALTRGVDVRVASWQNPSRPSDNLMRGGAAW